MVASRRDPLRSGVVVCLVLLLVPIGSAGDEDPLQQDDAGSGRDAPGHPSDAITILPGIRYEGSSTGPGTDDQDHYHLTGEAGQVFEARVDGILGCYYLLDAQGDPLGHSSCAFAHAPLYPEPIIAELPYTGDYHLLLAHLAPAVYQFAYNLSGPVPEVRTVHQIMGAGDPPAPAEATPIPEGCHGEYVMVHGDIIDIPRFTDDCYHMRTGLNSLDTPQIDVLIIPPASTYPERDLRTMRAAVEM